MKVIEISTGEFKQFVTIPKYWRGTIEGVTKNFERLDLQDPSIHYALGFRDLIYPPYNSMTQKLGPFIWDGDDITLQVIDLPDEEIKTKVTNNAKMQKDQFNRVKYEKQVESELQALTDDEEILENQAGYPLWSSFPDQFFFEANTKVRDFEGNELKLFKIITPHNKQDDRAPITVPALWDKIEFSGGVEVWSQPIGGDGKYPSIDPSTGELYQVTHNGVIWENTHPAPNLNVWEPGVFGWTQVI